VVHLRFGNLRKDAFHTLLARVWPQVETLIKSHKLVNVHAARIEGIGGWPAGRREEPVGGCDFIPPAVLRIRCISCVWRFVV